MVADEMDKLDFKVESKAAGPYENGVNIFINGKNLIDLLKEYELPFAQKESHENIAGAYSGVGSHDLLDRICKSGEHVTIFTCGSCGEDGCWPMVIAIIEEGNSIRWKNFRQPHRGKNSKASFWDYSKFPEFVFEKNDYNNALKKLADLASL